MFCRQLLKNENRGKGKGWVKVSIGGKVRFKWPDVFKNHDYLYSILARKQFLDK